MGAVIAAYLPSLLAGVARRGDGDGSGWAKGWQFQLALEVLQQLHRQSPSNRRGCSASSLAQVLRVDVLQLEPALEVLTALGWIGQLVEETDAEPPYILLADPDQTLLEPLMRQLLLDKTDATLPLWAAAGWLDIKLRQAL